MRQLCRFVLQGFLPLFFFSFHVMAGEGIQPIIPSLERPELPDYLEQSPGKNFTLPPLPKNRDNVFSSGLFELKGVVFEGNTVFSHDRLLTVAESFLNQRVGMADLEALRHRLTLFYVENGYVNSGALIKEGQKVSDGVVIYEIVEGRLNEIMLKGNGRLRPAYIKKRIWPEKDVPFNTGVLQERFRMLLQDPLIDRMNGNILPGTTPGEATLDLDVVRSRNWGVNISADNHSSANLGSERVGVNGFVRNVTGLGDALSATVGKTQGTDEYGASYLIPLRADNTTLLLNYSYSENAIIEASLDDLDIESKLESIELTLERPFYSTLQRNFTLGLSIKAEESRTYLMGIPFSFSRGDTDGKSRATVLRLLQSFQDRTADHALALRSTFSFGVDVFGPSIHSGNRPDSRFVSWLGQFQYAHRINDRLGQIIFRGDTQISDSPLLSMEQISVGGASSVRGYRENEFVRDNGYIFSMEWRIPLWQSENTPLRKTKFLQIAPFTDYGAAWDKDESAGDNALNSIGVGLLWSSPYLDAEIYYGYELEDAGNKKEYNLQDDGIHFSFNYKI